jgi:hypothetical protein
MRLAVRSTVVASALAIAAIAAPAASARFDLGPQQRPSDVNPSMGYAVPVAPPQAQTAGPSPEVHPNPDQQATQSGAGNPPISHLSRPERIAAIERLKELVLLNHVPPNGRDSNADLNATAHPIAAPAPTLKAPDNGFDWGDAAIGAGITLTLALLITVGSFAVRQRSQPRYP